jgi:hypothetical protein
MDVIDATKQELDDQIGVAIRAGNKNTARDLVRLKNIMVKEADASVPGYKTARDTFAGKAALENAAETGQMFMKMKPSDMAQITKSMSESERHFFKLGAKKAILDAVDTSQQTADLGKRLFGRNGDVKKLRFLFDDPQGFKQLRDTLKREVEFVITKNAAIGNSTTAKQLAASQDATLTLSDARNMISTPDAQAYTIGKIFKGLSSKRKSEANVEALSTLGDILLETGMPADRVIKLIKRGVRRELEAALMSAIKKQPTGAQKLPAVSAEIFSEKQNSTN